MWGLPYQYHDYDLIREWVVHNNVIINKELYSKFNSRTGNLIAHSMNFLSPTNLSLQFIRIKFSSILPSRNNSSIQNSKQIFFKWKRKTPKTLSNVKVLSIYLLVIFWTAKTSLLSSLHEITTDVCSLISSSLNGLQIRHQFFFHFQFRSSETLKQTSMTESATS